MKNETQVSFLIVNFETFSADEITTILGIKPSSILLKGQKKGGIYRSDAVWPTNTWRLDATPDENIL